MYFFHNVKFMANKHKSFFLLTVNPCLLVILNQYTVEIVLVHISVGIEKVVCVLSHIRFGINCGQTHYWGPGVFKAAYHAYGFCSVEEGLKSSYLCLWLRKLLAQEQAPHSQILFHSLSSYLGNRNCNLYLQTVGAGGEHEILKSTLFSPLGHPPLSLPTPPAHSLSHLSLEHTKESLPGMDPSCARRFLLCNKLNISLVRYCRARCHFAAFLPLARVHLCSLFTFRRLLVTDGVCETPVLWNQKQKTKKTPDFGVRLLDDSVTTCVSKQALRVNWQRRSLKVYF